jgi:chromosome segregation ATPase
MTHYDQKGQNVDDQYNAGRDINITNSSSLSKRKAEISREISEMTTDIAQLEVEIKKLESELRFLLYRSLPSEISTEVIFGKRDIIEDSILMFQVSLNSINNGNYDASKEIQALKDKYKCKKSDIESRKQHLLTLQNELKYLGRKEMVSDIVSVVRLFLDQ